MSARGGERARRGRVQAWMCLLLAVAAHAVAAAPAERYSGRPLVEVLRDLERAGLELVYSSAVVPPDLRVTVEPAATDPREALDELLAPLGLAARPGPGGALLIVPVATVPLRGRVLESSRGRPIAAATVSVPAVSRRTRTARDGTFEVRGLAPGDYELRIEAPGYFPRTAPSVRLPAPDGVVIELRPLPSVVTEVVVRPGQHALLREDLSADHTLDDTDLLLAPLAGGDVSRVAEMLPGVAAPDNSAAFNVRGSAAQDVSLVLDGLELYDPYHLQGFQSPFSVVDGNVVERIDFFGGGFTADLGDRHGGFLEITTVAPADASFTEVELGTLNSRFSRHSPMTRPTGTWLASARGWYPQALRDTIEIGRGEELRPRFADAYGKGAFVLGPRNVLSVHGLVFYDRLRFAEADEDVNEAVDARTRNAYGWVRLWTAWSAATSSETVISIGGIARRRGGASAPEDGPVLVRDDRDVEFYGLRHDTTLGLSPTRLLKLGLDVRKLRAAYRYATERPESPADTTAIGLDPQGTSLAAYAALRLRPVSELAVELGLRWDRQTYTDDNQLSPRLNATWRPGPATEVRFALGRVTQSQRIHELRVEDGETAFHRAESAEHAEVAVLHTLRRGLRFRADAYARRLTDLSPRYENLFEPVELFPETAGDRIAVRPTRARLRGVELTLRGAANRPFQWWVSYVRSAAEDVIDGRTVPRSWDQPHAARGLVGYRAGDRWSVSLIGSVHTGWPTTPVAVDEDGDDLVFVPRLDQRNAARLPGYGRLDFKARRVFVRPWGRLAVTVDVTNLTDRENPCCVDEFEAVPAEGGWVARPRYDSWLGLTPSVTVSWHP